MSRICSFVLLILIVCFFASPAAAQRPEAPSLDGLFDDWSADDILVQDPSGDASGGFDVTMLAGKMSRSGMLYLNFKITEALNLQNGERSDGTLAISIRHAEGRNDLALVLDLRNRSAFLSNAQNQKLGWTALGMTCLPTYASDQYELMVNLQSVGMRDFGRGVKVQISGSDNLEPALIRPSKFKVVDTPNRLSRERGTDFRVANLNTLQSGLANRERGDAIKRLLNAADADIFCFQEEWKENLFLAGISNAFSGQINHVWEGGCGIVSRKPVIRVPMKLDRAVAAAVEISKRERVVVIAAHFKCCGYVDSREDDLRVQQAQQIVGEIKKMRNGEFGEALANAGVIVLGDYNLVGSRSPLNELNKGGLSDVVLKCPADGSAYTWRSLRPDDSFWPGRLDLMTHSTHVKPVSSFILDSERLSPRDLKTGKLNRNDSRASDHLMLIGDFQFGN